MTVVLVIAAIVAAVICLVLILPCKACQRRRERLQAAYEHWRQTRTNADN
jgi:hypothetical protein